MKVTLSWLKTLLKISPSAKEIADRLTMIGLEVEEIETWGAPFSGVVVGEIETVEKIPNASKLLLCKVNVGESVKSIVCGAPNVKSGLRVAVALPGAVLSELGEIRAVTIRGVLSEGMICSEKELGLGNDHSGILELDSTYRVGEPLIPKNADSVLTINVPSNRADCLSVWGIARELSVIYGVPVHYPEIPHFSPETSEMISPPVQILAMEDCPRYSTQVIQNVRIGPSPQWLKERLESVGLHSINNVVDVTNYVMWETGQPLHAFDYDLLEGGGIVVQKVNGPFQFVTLDGETRQLEPGDLLICDQKKPVALAGIMGGANSEVSERTKAILLESAYFHPVTIRKTAKRLGISSEASQRFERGVDPNGTVRALERAVALILECAGGEVKSPVVDVYPAPIHEAKIPLRLERLSQVVGIEVPKHETIRILTGLGMKVEENKNQLSVSVPTFRPDLKREIDLIEEVIRHYGYDRIEPKHISTHPLAVPRNLEQECIELVRDVFTGFGFREALCSSLVPKQYTHVFTPEIQPVEIKNPLSPETAWLRTDLLPGLLEVTQWNHRRLNYDIRFFEVGRVFFKHGGENELPEERVYVAGVLSTSEKIKKLWKNAMPAVDFYALKGMVLGFLERMHCVPVDLSAFQRKGFASENTVAIQKNGQQIGWFGEIEEEILQSFEIQEKVFAFEINIHSLMEWAFQVPRYVPIPRFPPVRRDLCVVVDEEVPAGALLDTIRKNSGNYLYTVEVFDMYKGPQLPEGKKSLTFSLTFLSSERTLTENEIEPIFEKILKTLENAFSASLRR